jgi:uncharacterized protein YdeI (YjbR/CyaY-like superfamily)
MQPVFFLSVGELRAWLKANHDKASELVIGFYKTKTGKPTITYAEALDEMLAYGWIDGIRKGIDKERYLIRYTPRKSGSIWSNVNIKRVNELREMEKMHAAGIRAFESRRESRSGIYSYEKEPEKLGKEYEEIFRQNEKAWSFYKSMPPTYQRATAHLVNSAKREETRLRRLHELIRDSAEGRKIKALSY